VFNGETSLDVILAQFQQEQDAQSSHLVALIERILKLEEENKTLMGMVEKMWYAPNMPGAPETPDHPSFKK
jgi:hypothetical protein